MFKANEENPKFQLILGKYLQKSLTCKNCGYKITTYEESRYYLASVIGIMVFIVIAVISLVVYSMLPSIKNEEDFQ